MPTLSHRLRHLAPLLALALMLAPPLAAPAQAGELFWLSDSPPPKTVKSERTDEAEDKDTIHPSLKHLWVRQGDEVGSSRYLAEGDYRSTVSILDAYGQRQVLNPAPNNGLAHTQVEYTDIGFRNAYARRESLVGSTRLVEIAKLEVVKGCCCEHNIPPEQARAIVDPDQPLEIVREHLPKEDMYTRMVSGDTVRFKVYSRGLPLADVPVTMLTQQGWQRRTRTDANGQAEFTLIRDYFPHWSDFRRQKRESFVVVAELAAAETGAWQGRKYDTLKYQATLSGKYQPSPYDYKSYALGLGLAVFVLAFGGLAVYLYRRRRVKPFQEIRFGEGA